jgi:hypothetical protein
MPTYAKDTEVPADRSRSEIERTLQRYGASAFMYGWDGDRAVIGFELTGRRYRIVLPLPRRADFTRTDVRRQQRSQKATEEAWEQATRQRWRALALWIKAVLEASEAGITTLQEALQPFTVLPSGQTVGEWLAPQIDQAYQNRRMPPMLPGSTSVSIETEG